MTSPATRSATSSPDLVAGAMPSDSPAGPTPGPSGPGAVPVSRFRARDSDTAMPIDAISGPLFNLSSPSADLQRSLENRLQAVMDVNGSPEYALTWSTWDMPAGVPICRLRASARRTSGNGSGSSPSGWTTPQGHDAQGRSNPERLQRHGTKHGCRNLNDEAGLAGWPTPTSLSPATADYNEAGDSCNLRKTRLLLTGWPTPKQRDHHTEGPGQYSPSLAKVAEQPVGWATPTARDTQSEKRTTDARKRREMDHRSTALGFQALGSLAPTGTRGALNPALSRWLMGYPPAWGNCAPTAMPSSRRSRRSSSAPIERVVR